MMKDLLRGLTPPLLWRAASKLRRAASGGGPQWEHGVEQPPEFYDWSFEGNAH